MAKLKTIFLAPLLLAASFGLPSLAQSQPRDAKEFDAASPVSCIELKDRGIPLSALNSLLIAQAGASKGPLQRSLKFFKALKSPLSDEILYIYVPQGITDTWVIYVADKLQKRILRKSVYGSMYYSCPRPRPQHVA